MRPAGRQRLLELLADRATQGLPPTERLECERLLAIHQDVDPDSLDGVAALLDLALAPPVARTPPSGLLRRLRNDAERRFG